ncbi:hypothetical protein [Streptomyces sp. NBC_00658]|uniref:hypothetical protein n=1 Tax=Streptomyces sp. NBC_00658 TaxID=2975800 RepID=UPI00324763F6
MISSAGRRLGVALAFPCSSAVVPFPSLSGGRGDDGGFVVVGECSQLVAGSSPVDVAEDALDHLGDGPTWIHGSDTPTGGSPFGALPRRDAVLAMSRGASGEPKAHNR